MMTTDRTWAEIRPDIILQNIAVIRRGLPAGTKFLGVIKANAYGHGAMTVAKALEAGGCEYLAAATASEAMEVRQCGVKLPILIFGWTDPMWAETLIREDITQAVSEPELAKALSAAARALGKKAKIHLKLDSGMGRTGFVCRDGRDPLRELEPVLSLPGLELEGIFTHFAVSETDKAYTATQYRDYLRCVAAVEAYLGHRIPIRHCSNSGAALQYPEFAMDMVRPGIAMYGVCPDAAVACPGLVPAMTLKTRIYQIRDLLPGESVSYGRHYIAASPRKIAVLPIGYADGLHRALSGKAVFSLHGQPLRQVGSICMDMCMADVTDIPEARVGDEVTVFGASPNVAELAALAGTIPYELLCAISPRVPRLYI